MLDEMSLQSLPENQLKAYLFFPLQDHKGLGKNNLHGACVD